eukprot:1137460-Prymnesium_polylepis.3
MANGRQEGRAIVAPATDDRIVFTCGLSARDTVPGGPAACTVRERHRAARRATVPVGLAATVAIAGTWLGSERARKTQQAMLMAYKPRMSSARSSCVDRS